MTIDSLQLSILKWRNEQQEKHGVGYPLDIVLKRSSYEILGEPAMIFGMWVSVRES